MGYTFNGSDKVVSLTLGTTVLDVRDLYSRWKDWVVSTGSMFLQGISVVGGEPVDESQGIYVTSYFFLENGWKIKPQEANHKLKVTSGVLVTSDGSDPFVPTEGSYNVLVQYSQPVKSETVSTGGGSGGATAEEIWEYPTREITNDLLTLADVEGSTILAKESSVEALNTYLVRVLGLSHENFRIASPVYNGDGNMTSATIKLYGSKADCDSDTSPIATYSIAAVYTGASLTSYKMTRET